MTIMIKLALTIMAAGLLAVPTAPTAAAAPPDRSTVFILMPNPCNGDEVEAQGTLTQHFTERPDGGYTSHFRADVAGTGQPSGDQYRFDQNWHSQQVTSQDRFSLRERIVVKNLSGGPSFTSVFVLRYQDGVLVTSVNDQTCK
jgi:hypothetical protein